MSDNTELEFLTAAELTVKVFGPEHRVIYGVEVRMKEHLPDGTVRIRIARWGQSTEQGE